MNRYKKSKREKSGMLLLIKLISLFGFGMGNYFFITNDFESAAQTLLFSGIVPLMMAFLKWV